MAVQKRAVSTGPAPAIDYSLFRKSPSAFSEHFLKLQQYDWQKKVLDDLASFNRVALKAANGSGKTSMVAAPLVVWWCARFPRSQVVTTAGVFRQVRDQLWQQIHQWGSVLNGWAINASDLAAPNGSKAIGFSTDEPTRFEGWHNDRLLMIFDEAKSIPDGIWHAAERCQPTSWLAMSSTGNIDTRFAKCFLNPTSKWLKHSVTAYDCKHLVDRGSYIQDQIDEYGADHPLVRSMIFSEFLAGDEGDTVLNMSKLRDLKDKPPQPLKDTPLAFIDWGGGGDETVIAVRNGNKVLPLIAWVAKDTMSTVGRAMTELTKLGVPKDGVWADDGGLGRPMNDRMAEKGWSVHRFNFGAKARNPAYMHRGAEVWWELARLVEKKQVILPDDELLNTQLVTRRVRVNSSGKLGLEPKDEMRKRGASSPDRADAVAGVCGAVPIGGVLTEFETDSTSVRSNEYFPQQEVEREFYADCGIFAGGE